MDPVWLLLLLPLAAAGGWLMAKQDQHTPAPPADLPDAYFKGLSFLLNEEPDKALEVFMKVVEVDSETVEMHMALGNLFRRRGEIERATRIHQNLVARADLEAGLRHLALFELAQDYFKAGLFDRAENLFIELVQSGEYAAQSGGFLLQIYDQEKEWPKAVEVATKLQQSTGTDYSGQIAHYHCEMAEQAIGEGHYNQAETHLESAFSSDPKCIRAVIQSGRLASIRGNHASAIAIWRGLEHWSPVALGEVVGLIANSYRAMNDTRSLRRFLENAVEVSPDPRIISMLVELTGEAGGREARQTLLTNIVRKYPSLDSLYQLMLSRRNDKSGSREDRDYSLLAELLSEIVEGGRDYNCRQCGFQSSTLHWQCPGCKGWGTVQRVFGSQESRNRRAAGQPFQSIT